MKTKILFTVIVLFLFSATLVNAQEAVKTSASSPESSTKAQDHNSTRSNKTSSVAAPDNSGAGGTEVSKENQNTTQSTQIKTNANETGSGTNLSKKGYDYYQAKSDLKPNSAAEKSTGTDDKTNKSEAARAKKK